MPDVLVNNGSITLFSAARRTIGSAFEDTVSAANFYDVALAPAVFTTRDSGVSTSAEMQAFVNYCRTNRRQGRLRAGYYKLDEPVWLTQDGLQCVSIVGEGCGYDIVAGTGGVTAETIIDVSAVTDKPGLIIQLGRSVWLSDLAIIGPNAAPSSLTAVSADGSAYLTDGVRDTRYSPQCAICIDPTIGVDPGGGQGYSGLGDYTGSSSGSANVYLSRLNFRQHNVAVMVSPAADSAQGDGVYIDKCHFQDLKYAVASGQSQPRGMFIDKCVMANLWKALDSNTFGKRAGAIHSIQNSQINTCSALFDISTTIQSFLAANIYGERVMSIGRFGTGAPDAQKPATLLNVTLHLGEASHDELPAPVLLETTGPLTIAGCGFVNYVAGLEPFNIVGSNAPTRLEGSNFSEVSASALRMVVGVRMDYAATTPPIIDGCDRDGGSERRYSDVQTRRFALPPRINATYGTREVSDKDNIYRYVAGHNNTYIASSVSSYVVDTEDAIVTFTAASPGDFVVGDLLFAAVRTLSGTDALVLALRVAIIDGSSITADMLFDPTFYDTEADPDYAYIYAEEWAPGQALTGDTELGSTTLSNVSPTTIVRDGDFISGAGLQPLTRVVSGAGTATLTINKTATATDPGVALHWGRLHTYDTTAGF